MRDCVFDQHRSSPSECRLDSVDFSPLQRYRHLPPVILAATQCHEHGSASQQNLVEKASNHRLQCGPTSDPTDYPPHWVSSRFQRSRQKGGPARVYKSSKYPRSGSHILLGESTVCFDRRTHDSRREDNRLEPLLARPDWHSLSSPAHLEQVLLRRRVMRHAALPPDELLARHRLQ